MKLVVQRGAAANGQHFEQEASKRPNMGSKISRSGGFVTKNVIQLSPAEGFVSLQSYV